LAINFELCLLYLAFLSSWPNSVTLDHATIQGMASGLSEDTEFLLSFDRTVHSVLREFICRAVEELLNPSAPSSLLKQGEDLGESISKTLLGRVSAISAAAK
jgi:hypothetical protein